MGIASLALSSSVVDEGCGLKWVWSSVRGGVKGEYWSLALQGAQEIFSQLPHEFVSPDCLKDVVENGGMRNPVAICIDFIHPFPFLLPLSFLSYPPSTSLSPHSPSLFPPSPLLPHFSPLLSFFPLPPPPPCRHPQGVRVCSGQEGPPGEERWRGI